MNKELWTSQGGKFFEQDHLCIGLLRLLEENVVLKKHAVKQEEKIKKLATKLIRVMSDKKRLEIGGNNASNIRGHRDLETEELIEDQQQRIRELERINSQFKDKLMVAKNQIMAVNHQSSSRG